MEYMSGWAGELPTSLSAGTFTPFLGAGASSLRSREEISFDVYPWDNVGKTLATIHAEIAGKESRHFLRLFAQERLRMTSEQLADLMPDVAGPGAPREPGAETLIDLQVALVRVMRRLTEIFGDEFAKQVPSLRELPDCAVSFDIKEEEEQAAWDRLCEAATVAKTLSERKAQDPTFRGADAPWLPPDAKRSFRVARVYERLVVLARLLLSDAGESYARSHKELRKKFRDNPDLSSLGDALIEAKVPRGKLRLDMMQWLGDLLEHSLLYWIPRFPTTVELAFELGLAVPSGPPRRPELAQAAQAFDAVDSKKTSAGDYIKELMEYCESGLQEGKADPIYRRFYVAIATALCDQWDHYRVYGHTRGDRDTEGIAEFRQFGRGQSDGEAAEAPPRVAFMPIAATTNYDSGLELVFDKARIAYHVMFPVESGSSGGVLQWVFRTVVPKETDYDVKMSSKDEKLPAVLQGPVIVKLHGAPALRKARDQYGYLRHKIVVSEKEYLDALQEVSSVLQWFETEMFKPLEESFSRDAGPRARTIWFLGYSIADWNVRLRLYSHLRGHPRDERLLRAVNRDYDPFRQSILKDLKVTLCHGDLSKVPDAILAYYNDHFSSSSPAVQELVRYMRAGCPRDWTWKGNS